eukprot:3533928-Rhodomonas_salina.3
MRTGRTGGKEEGTSVSGSDHIPAMSYKSRTISSLSTFGTCPSQGGGLARPYRTHRQCKQRKMQRAGRETHRDRETSHLRRVELGDLLCHSPRRLQAVHRAMEGVDATL